MPTRLVITRPPAGAASQRSSCRLDMRHDRRRGLLGCAAAVVFGQAPDPDAVRRRRTAEGVGGDQRGLDRVADVAVAAHPVSLAMRLRKYGFLFAPTTSVCESTLSMVIFHGPTPLPVFTVSVANVDEIAVQVPAATEVVRSKLLVIVTVELFVQLVPPPTKLRVIGWL